MYLVLGHPLGHFSLTVFPKISLYLCSALASYSQTVTVSFLLSVLTNLDSDI